VRRPVVVALALLAASGWGCQTTAPSPASPPPGPADQAPTAEIENTTWQLVTLGGAPLPDGIKRAPNLRLEPGQKRLVGFGGCNRIFGGYDLEGGSLKLSPLGTTKMGCLGPAMPLEKKFLDALERVATWTISGDTLTLRAAEGGDQIATLRAVAPE
jgi:heat shock protein HslJ